MSLLKMPTGKFDNVGIRTFNLFTVNSNIFAAICTFAVIPYAIIYFVMVMIVTEENGGWNDIYGFATRVPFWVPTILFLPLTFSIATLIRLWHNHSFVKRRNNEAQIFLNHFEGKKAEEIIFEIGKARAKIQPSGDLIVPMLVIKQIVYFTDSELSIEDASKLYLDGYLCATKK